MNINQTEWQDYYEGLKVEGTEQEKELLLARFNALKAADPKDFTAEGCAKRFAEILKTWLTPQQMAEVVKRNDAQENPGVCHSNDFCDANMAMAEAFEKFGIVVDPQDDDHAAKWSEAWDIAKQNAFWI